jgi:2-oxo-3-hexenedioate decarboxylase/2-keto-4-pentenoate hydratase
MQTQAMQAAAAILADLRLRANGRTSPLDALPESCRPATLDDAYALQDVLRALLAKRGLGAPCGWKIGCTTAVMQAYLDIPHPCAGTLYRNSVSSGETRLKAADYFKLGLECEIAVRMAADFDARSAGRDPKALSAAVGEVMASIELIDHRFRDFTTVPPPSLVADDFFSVGCALGAPRPLADAGDLATIAGSFWIDGEPASEHGVGAAILGHPLDALMWLAEHLAERGAKLRAGDVVTLGSVVKTIYPEAGAHVEARFDRLPPVLLRIA